MEKQKFKVGDKVRVGNCKFGYDIARIKEIHSTVGERSFQYYLTVLTRTGYLANRWLDSGTDSIRYVYPLENWVMEYAENALQRLKKRYAKQV